MKILSQFTLPSCLFKPKKNMLHFKLFLVTLYNEVYVSLYSTLMHLLQYTNDDY